VKKAIIILFLLFFGISLRTNAQSDSTGVQKDSIDFYEMSLEQLLKIKAHGVPSELEKLINSLIAVASKKPLNTRESPSIVSLITEDEIKKSGARDIMDVLRLVPGIDFGLDVEGVVGIGIRGNWAHEGKVLVLLDGQEQNEMLFATTQFGNHFPIEQIKKIEVIRGPGSAIYGGFAEYGVINIITRQAEDINGVTISGTYGQMASDYGRRNANLSIGKKIGDFSFSLSGVYGQGQRSDAEYTDPNDSTYSMAGNSSLNPRYFNAAVAYKGLSARFIGDFYQTTVGQGYGEINQEGAVEENYKSMYSEVKYVLNLDDKLTITPRINWKKQTPWQTEAYGEKEAYDRTATRTTVNVTASYNANRYINFVLGGESNKDKATENLDSAFFNNHNKQIEYSSYAFFGQGLIKTRFVNFIVGARYDKHNIYGDAFVPRIGLTKKYKKFHFKALYSNSFRAPAIENIDLAPEEGIRPEFTQVAELELGYQVTRKSIFTANFYDISTDNPIIYYTDNSADYYMNFGHSGTRGAEAEFRIKDKWGHVALNYAFYTAGGKEKVGLYEVAESESSLLGFANHRINLNACWNVTKDLSVNLTGSYYDKRWACTGVDTLGNTIQEQLDPTILVNLFIKYNTPVKGLSISAGVYDALNHNINFIQPYDGGHPPLPGPTREIIFRLQYDLNFKKKSD
jgi:outer membrane receptor for ferrienterochelin and colicin